MFKGKASSNEQVTLVNNTARKLGKSILMNLYNPFLCRVGCTCCLASNERNQLRYWGLDHMIGSQEVWLLSCWSDLLPSWVDASMTRAPTMERNWGEVGSSNSL